MIALSTKYGSGRPCVKLAFEAARAWERTSAMKRRTFEQFVISIDFNQKFKDIFGSPTFKVRKGKTIVRGRQSSGNRARTGAGRLQPSVKSNDVSSRKPSFDISEDAQATMETWTARLISCFDSRKPSTKNSESAKAEIKWLVVQADKAREDLSQREELAKAREYLLKLIESGGEKGAFPGNELFRNSLASLKPVGKVLSFPHTPSFFPKDMTNSLLIRDSYVSLFELIMKNLGQEKPRIRIAITGNPGIGKSVFLFYVMWRLASMNEVGAVVLHRGKDAGLIYVFEKTRFWKTRDLGDVDNYLVLSNTWYLTDTLDPPPGEVNAVTILVASPSRKHYKTFLKYSRTDSLRYLPVWSLEELRKAAVFCDISVKDVDERYRLVGGVARLVLDLAREFESEIDFAVEWLVMDNFTSLASGGASAEDILFDLIVHNVVDPDFSRRTIQFCSAYVAEKVFDRFLQYDQRKLSDFILTRDPASICSGIRQNLFDYFAPRFFVDASKTESKLVF